MSKQRLTVDQVLDEIERIPQSLHGFFELLADCVQRADPPLRDAIDFKIWLHQLSDAATKRSIRRRAVTAPEQKRWS